MAKPFNEWTVLPRGELNRLDAPLLVVTGLAAEERFFERELEAQATGARVLHRLGWLAEVAEWIASQLSVSRIHPPKIRFSPTSGCWIVT